MSVSSAFIITAVIVSLCMAAAITIVFIIGDKLRVAHQAGKKGKRLTSIRQIDHAWLASVQMERFKALNDEQKNYAVSFFCGYVGMTEEGFTEPDMDHDHALWARLQLTKAIDKSIIDV